MNKSIRTSPRFALLAVIVLLLQNSSANLGWGQATRAHTHTAEATGRGIQIIYNNIDVSGMTLGKSPLLWVGQDIRLYARVTNNIQAGSRLSFSHWEVSPAGNPISGWTPTKDSNETASVIPIPNDNVQSLILYYVAGGNSGLKAIAHIVTAMGRDGKAFVNFIVTRPTGYSSVATPGTVQVVSGQNQNSYGFYWLEFGDDADVTYNAPPRPGKSGMYITATMPASVGGHVQWVQLISSDAFGNKVGLDTRYPYSEQYVPVNDLADSPGFSVPTPSPTYSRADHFTSYFMWKPSVPDGIFVPLFAYQWGWSGTDVYDPNKSPDFILSQHNVAPVNLDDPITMEPTWDHTIHTDK